MFLVNRVHLDSLDHQVHLEREAQEVLVAKMGHLVSPDKMELMDVMEYLEHLDCLYVFFPANK